MSRSSGLTLPSFEYSWFCFWDFCLFVGCSLLGSMCSCIWYSLRTCCRAGAGQHGRQGTCRPLIWGGSGGRLWHQPHALQHVHL